MPCPRYAGVVAHSLVVGASAENPATGGLADAVLAAYNCSEAALRLIKAGNTNKQVMLLNVMDTDLRLSPEIVACDVKLATSFVPNAIASFWDFFVVKSVSSVLLLQ